jgi:hypothetical protein
MLHRVPHLRHRQKDRTDLRPAFPRLLRDRHFLGLLQGTWVIHGVKIMRSPTIFPPRTFIPAPTFKQGETIHIMSLDAEDILF